MQGVDYYINHVNKTTTYHNPLKDYVHEDPPPSPREVSQLLRYTLMRWLIFGFGKIVTRQSASIQTLAIQ